MKRRHDVIVLEKTGPFIGNKFQEVKINLISAFKRWKVHSSSEKMNFQEEIINFFRLIKYI